MVCAAGAHPDPQRAVHHALVELGPLIGLHSDRYAEKGTAERARRMVRDPFQVTRMEDHALLYSAPEAASRLAFLTGSTRQRAVADIGAADPGGFASRDLRVNLEEAVDRYTSRGMDVVVVDQTSPELHAGGLACVKVLIPGTLPMTFGHQHRRLTGLPRVHQMPQLLGYRERRLRPDEINPHPHPFP